jgi:hypothetical protein
MFYEIYYAFNIYETILIEEANRMSLKLAVFELKEAVLNQKQNELEEKYIFELETKHQLKPGTLVSYFNTLMMLHLSDHQKKTNGQAEKTNRKWQKFEIEFMQLYIKDRQEEGAQNITEVLDEVAQILDRGYQSVNYKYYTVSKVKEKKNAKETKEVANGASYTFQTIEQDQLPVLSTSTFYPTEVVESPANPSNDDDLLDILSGLITNVQQLPGINLNELLRSLYLLTSMAIQNKDVGHQLESMKVEMNKEKASLDAQLKKKEQQLMYEMKRNDELQAEVSKLAKEVAAFNQLGDAAKVQNLKSYNQRLKYIIDGFGGVLQIGS